MWRKQQVQRKQENEGGFGITHHRRSAFSLVLPAAGYDRGTYVLVFHFWMDAGDLFLLSRSACWCFFFVVATERLQENIDYRKKKAGTNLYDHQSGPGSWAVPQSSVLRSGINSTTILSPRVGITCRTDANAVYVICCMCEQYASIEMIEHNTSTWYYHVISGTTGIGVAPDRFLCFFLLVFGFSGIISLWFLFFWVVCLHIWRRCVFCGCLLPVPGMYGCWCRRGVWVWVCVEFCRRRRRPRRHRRLKRRVFFSFFAILFFYEIHFNIFEIMCKYMYHVYINSTRNNSKVVRTRYYVYVSACICSLVVACTAVTTLLVYCCVLIVYTV